MPESAIAFCLQTVQETILAHMPAIQILQTAGLGEPCKAPTLTLRKLAVIAEACPKGSQMKASARDGRAECMYMQKQLLIPGTGALLYTSVKWYYQKGFVSFFSDTSAGCMSADTPGFVSHQRNPRCMYSTQSESNHGACEVGGGEQLA